LIRQHLQKIAQKQIQNKKGAVIDLTKTLDMRSGSSMTISGSEAKEKIAA